MKTRGKSSQTQALGSGWIVNMMCWGFFLPSFIVSFLNLGLYFLPHWFKALCGQF